MKHVLTAFLFFLFVSPMFSQNIEELELALQKATSPKSKIHFSEKLAEKLLVKNPDKAAQYASEAYQIAQQSGDSKSLANIAYLEGKIHIRKSETPQAIAQFQKALKHAKSSKDTEFAYRCIKKLVALTKKDRAYRKAISYAEEGMLLLHEARKIPVVEAASGQDTFDEPAIQGHTGRSQIDKNPESELGQMQTEKLKLQEEIALLNAERDEHFSFSLDGKKKGVPIKQISSGRSEQEIYLAQAELEKQNRHQFVLILGGMAATILFLGWIIFYRYREKKKVKRLLAEKNQIITEERKRAEELLHNVLPAAVANDLHHNGKSIGKKYDFATVLFADFKNFTKISKQLQPEQLVKELDHCFKGFDYIISQYDNIEKIKTIGDTYLCATGLTTRETIPTNLVKAALEMQDFLNEYKKDKIARSEPFFEARIGIHTGAVVAGVVGFNKFGYDIWGDTVNIAADMETHCEEGKVNISAETYRLVKYDFDCEHRGAIEVENKELIDMYYVN